MSYRDKFKSHHTDLNNSDFTYNTFRRVAIAGLPFYEPLVQVKNQVTSNKYCSTGKGNLHFLTLEVHYHYTTKKVFNPAKNKIHNFEGKR